MVMRLSLNVEEADERPFINTGGPLDILNGAFIPTVNGTLCLSGGLGLTNGIIATANRFKSTLLNSSAINVLARFPDSTYYLGDSEYSTINKKRLSSMSDLYLDDDTKREEHLKELQSRITIFDQTSPQFESLDAFFDFLKEIREEKIKHYKDYLVETEILDIKTQKPYTMLLPTLAACDSWTEAMVRQLNVKNEEHNAQTEMKDQRTINMEEGWQKARLMRQLPSLCAKAGIYFMLTGHLGKKIAVDGKPTAKDMQYMSPDETTKAMSNRFNFTMSSIWKISNTEALVDKNDRHLSEYPSEDSVAGSELQRLLISLVRSKNSNSGYASSLVSSQRFGIMNGLSYYDALRSNKYYGIGQPNKVRSPLLGDRNIGRTKIFDESRKYEVKRALELTYQLFYIQNYWTLVGLPVDFTIPFEQFADKLMNGTGYAISDILNSRGWWTYKGANVDRDYLSLPDILAIINGSYKPKFLSVKG